jgi:predicted DNA-binding protein
VASNGLHHRNMSGTPGKAPTITFRVPPVLMQALDARAEAEGRKRSEIVREAIEAHVVDHGKVAS